MNRRSLLKTVGAAGMVGLTGLAGCTGGGGGGDQRPGVGGSGGTSGGSSGGGNSSGSGNGGSGTIKIGAVPPLSGSYGGLGKYQRNGLKLAARVVNENGGINGKNVRILVEDSQGSPQTGRQKARKLVKQNGVVALTGAISSSVGLGLADYAASQNIPYLCPCAANEFTMSNCKETTFRYELRASQVAAGTAPWAVDKFGTKIWVHNADYAWGNSVAKSFKENAKAHNSNVNVLGHTKSDLGASDFSSYISQISASSAEWLVTGLNGGDAVNFLKQASGYGLKDEITIVSPTNSFQFIRRGAGQAAVGTYSTIRYYPKYDKKANEMFVKAYSDAYNTPPDNFANVAWTSMQMYANAANQAGTTETDPVLRALEKVQYESPMGPANFRKCDHQAVRPVINGKIISPADYDWPDLEVLQTTSGQDAIQKCEEIDCSL
jgi:branched-chain amino acid transport system substrate-binding protein